MSDSTTTSNQGASTPPFRYSARLASDIESRWQDMWDANGTFEAPNPAGPLADPAKVAGREKLFILDMFPYPSGAGLHVGHPLGYIGTDVFARFKRMQLSHFEGFGGKVHAQHLRTLARHGIGQNATATTDVHHIQARQGHQAVDPLQAQRVDLVQGSKFAFRVPPTVGQI